MCPAVEPRNSGQPGCTPAERERHSRLLASGAGLVDAFRLLHPVARPPGGESEVGSEGYDGGAGFGTDTDGITWRGTAGSDVAEMGRFYGKVRDSRKSRMPYVCFAALEFLWNTRDVELVPRWVLGCYFGHSGFIRAVILYFGNLGSIVAAS